MITFRKGAILKDGIEVGYFTQDNILGKEKAWFACLPNIGTAQPRNVVATARTKKILLARCADKF